MTSRGIGEDEIEQFLLDYEASEDGFEDDDDSVADPEYLPDLEPPFEDETAEEIDGMNIDSIIEDLERGGSNSSPSPSPVASTQPGPSARRQTKNKLNVRWRKKNIELNEQQLRFTGDETLSPEVLDLETPIQFFLKLFPKELIEVIASQTNLYIVQKDPNMSFRVTETDIQQFIGLVYIMSLVHLPRVTKHWHGCIGTPLVKETMAVNKFEKIRRFIHFNDNTKNVPREHPDHDRIFKIRPVPHIVGEYNRHMGGVDLIDSIMGRYKIRLRSKRWQIRMFYHFLDLVMSNAWLLYKRVHKAKKREDPMLQSADFRQDIALVLCKLGTKANQKRRTIEQDIQAKKHKGPAQYVPPAAVRQDQVGHWPIWAEKRIRCKYPNCAGVSQTICEKCGVALCYNKQNNCFKAFHTS